MENKNQPISPISKDEKDILDKCPGISYLGLTKREYFSILAMQALLSNPNIIDNHNDESAEWIARHARKQADELLKIL